MSGTCGLDFERHVSASSFEVRRVIGEAVRELGFEITVDQLTRIEAKRGGILGSSLMIKKQMAVTAVFEVAPDGSGCTVAAHLIDNVKSFGKTFGINRQYREIFDEVARRVDVGLAGLDKAAATRRVKVTSASSSDIRALSTSPCGLVWKFTVHLPFSSSSGVSKRS